MPPANSPSDGPSRSPSAAASSLQSLPAVVSDDAHSDNVSFLRSRVRPAPDPASSHPRADYHLRAERRRRENIQQLQAQLDAQLDASLMDLDDASMRMSVEVNRRIPIVHRQRDGSNEDNHATIDYNILPNYEGRTSYPRTLYGWAPTSDNDDEEDDIPYPPIHSNALTSWLGRLSERSTSRRSVRRDATGRDPRTTFSSTEEGPRPNDNTGSIPDSSLVRSIPRQPRFSRTRTLHDYLLDRAEERERPSGTTASRAYRYLPSSRNGQSRVSQNDLLARVSGHRPMHLENPPNPRLKETIRYLDRLRYSRSFEESLTSAAAGGFVQLDLFAWDEDDFILDTSSISPPPACSWLRPGMTFTGSQKAASSTSVILSDHAAVPPTNDPLIVNGSDQNRISVQTSNGRRYLASQIWNIASGNPERWPVKVSIHDINTKDMTLSGTMEAYNIPDKTSLSHDAHIITFLEGEIIDFNTHTLETKNFKADAEIDSTYWRELQPFKDLTDEEMTRNLVSRKWITEELCKGWILMRWKERCFITPTDARQGLTISGFYYISLHRETGHIEGLYYDPGSSPYQQLSLKPETKMTRPSYSFR